MTRARAAWRRRAWIGFLLAPGMAVMLLFVVVPLVSAFLDAFRAFNGAAPGPFVGLAQLRVRAARPGFCADHLPRALAQRDRLRLA